MLFKKKPKGLSVIHYAGLPGFQQDMPCFMDIGEEAVVFSTTAGASVTLPLSKIECVDIMPEANYMLKYHNANTATAKVGVKWYAAITYAAEGGSKHIAVWYMEVKTGKALYALQSRCTRSGGVVL